MKRIILFMLALACIGFAQAQIGVNTSAPKVSLDVQAAAVDATTAEGIAAPRLTLLELASKDAKYAIDQIGTLVYVTDVTGTPTANTVKTRNVIAKGYYYFDGTFWQTTGPDQGQRFIYMPSIVLPTNITDPSYNSGTQTFTINLYTIYAAQYGLTNPGTWIKSPTATTLPVLASSDVDYLITYYDNTVYQNVAVSNTGVLTYKLVGGFTLSDKTFMNILFKVK